MILKDSEADARTVDVMRLLLFNALDSVVVSRGEISPGKELVHESARRLLLELLELSEKPVNPVLPKPAAAKVALPPKERVFKSRSDEPSQRVRSQYNADWACPK